MEPEQSLSSAKQDARMVVVGAGIMGHGIAQVAAVAGVPTTLVDVSAEALERALAGIDRGLGRMLAAERLSDEQARMARTRLTTTTDLEKAAADADFVIEAVVEDVAVKEEVLARLDASAPADAVLASNTSQFSISRLAAATRRGDRVIGAHWFNPPPVMKLVEIVCGVETSDETLARTVALTERLGKQTVVCSKDTPGFITTRLISSLAIEAMRIVEEGIATSEDVDRACVLAFKHAMGPLDTIDFSGLDTTLRVADELARQYGERFLAPQNIRALVNAGHIGRKSGRGFGRYDEA